MPPSSLSLSLSLWHYYRIYHHKLTNVFTNSLYTRAWPMHLKASIFSFCLKTQQIHHMVIARPNLYIFLQISTNISGEPHCLGVKVWPQKECRVLLVLLVDLWHESRHFIHFQTTIFTQAKLVKGHLEMHLFNHLDGFDAQGKPSGTSSMPNIPSIMIVSFLLSWRCEMIIHFWYSLANSY